MNWTSAREPVQTLKALGLSILLLLSSSVAIHGQFSFTTNINGSLNITGYAGLDRAVIIPGEIKGRPVGTIGTNAFYHATNLVSVVIPDSVTSIGQMAFWYCSRLSSVTLGTNLTAIQDAAFAMCPSLTNVLLPNKLTLLGSAAFYSCNALTNITIPDGIGAIGGQTFQRCSSLTAVNIPISVTNISDSAFQEAGLAEITVPDRVGSLGVDAFYGCHGLIRVNLGTGLRNIGGRAFANCTSLPDIYLPNNVTNIAPQTFRGCSSLTNVTIGSGVAAISDDAFYDCTVLAAFTVGSSNSVYSSLDGVLFDRTGTRLILWPWGKTGDYVVPDGVTSIASFAFYCPGPTTVTIPASVAVIEAHAFECCGNLSRVTIGSGVVGSFAFYNCASLSTVTICPGVSYLDDGAFAYCGNLRSIYCQDAAPGLGVNVFCYIVGYPVYEVYWDPVVIYYLSGKTGWDAPVFGGRPAVLWNPRTETADPRFGIGTNGFGFNITGTSNIFVLIEACTNLANPSWQALETASLTNGSTYFSDPNWTKYAGRYYRLRSP